jgi:hypothetical protein
MKLSEYMRYRNYSRRQLMEEGTFRIDIDPATLKLGYPFGVYLFVVTLEQRDIFNSDGKLVQCRSAKPQLYHYDYTIH